MKKPSIYSDRYRNVKKRVRLKRKIVLFLAALVLFLLFFIPYLGDKVKEFKANGNQFPGQGQTTPLIRPTETGGTSKPATTATASSAEESNVLKTTHRLPNGGELSIEYEITDQGLVRYLGVQGDEATFTYHVSPKEGQLLINTLADQGLILYGPELKLEDRSINTYSHSEKGTLKREDYLKKSNFLWMGNARFMSEDVILFESHMSRALDKTYIWYYKITDGTYKLISGTGSETTKLIQSTDKGYEVEIDGEVQLITSDLKVAE